MFNSGSFFQHREPFGALLCLFVIFVRPKTRPEMQPETNAKSYAAPEITCQDIRIESGFASSPSEDTGPTIKDMDLIVLEEV